MLSREFQHKGRKYRITLKKYNFQLYVEDVLDTFQGGVCMAIAGFDPHVWRKTSEIEPLASALKALAKDPYKGLKRTHTAAIDKMIATLFLEQYGRQPKWDELLKIRAKNLLS